LIKLSAALGKELSSLPERPRIMVIGETDTGKSTLVGLMARWFRSAPAKVVVVDSDIGQSDVGPPGFVSYGTVEQGITSLQSVTRNGSYMVGNTSPYNRELSVAAGTQACVREAQRQGADVILVDTCGLVKGVPGVQLKCAKAEAVRPDLIITLSTPGLELLTGCLKLLGFRVCSFLPLRGARTKSVDERRDNRVSCWNTYLGSRPRLLSVDLSRVKVRRWWGESRYVDVNQVPHGTVAAVRDPRHPDFQAACIFMVSKESEGWDGGEAAEGADRAEGCPSILVPLPQDYEPDVVWVCSYKLGLDGTRVISA